MRIPKVKSKNIDKLKKIVLNIKSYIMPNYYHIYDELEMDDKTKSKIIKKIETFVRGSVEYRRYTNFLKEEVDMNECSFFKNVSRETNKQIKIEIHHSPLTLFDITNIVFTQFMREHRTFSLLDVAETVTRLHFENKVGLIPLSDTVHELVHSGEIFVPLNYVYGNFKAFVEEYSLGISAEHEELLRKHIQMTRSLVDVEYAPSVLERKAVYLNIDGMEFPKMFDVEHKEAV